MHKNWTQRDFVLTDCTVKSENNQNTKLYLHIVRQTATKTYNLIMLFLQRASSLIVDINLL